MKTTFKLKDEAKQAALEKAFDTFAKELHKSCEAQWNDCSDFILIEHVKPSYYGLKIKKADIEKKEKLYLYKWYPPSMFDGNPKGYVLVEILGDGGYCFSRAGGGANLNELHCQCRQFMYVHQTKEQDES